MQIIHSSDKTVILDKTITNKYLDNIIISYLIKLIPDYITSNGNGHPEYINISQASDGSIYSSVKYENNFGKLGVSQDYFDNYTFDLVLQNLLIYLFEKRVNLKPTGYF